MPEIKLKRYVNKYAVIERLRTVEKVTVTIEGNTLSCSDEDYEVVLAFCQSKHIKETLRDE